MRVYTIIFRHPLRLKPTSIPLSICYKASAAELHPRDARDILGEGDRRG
jgi:hypothetical protein